MIPMAPRAVQEDSVLVPTPMAPVAVEELEETQILTALAAEPTMIAMVPLAVKLIPGTAVVQLLVPATATNLAAMAIRSWAISSHLRDLAIAPGRIAAGMTLMAPVQQEGPVLATKAAAMARIPESTAVLKVWAITANHTLVVMRLMDPGALRVRAMATRVAAMEMTTIARTTPLQAR